jgi:AcrR family transcriptional regulator
MQHEPENARRRSNRARSEATRNALEKAARRLFVEKGYAETSTPDIVAAANVTRGALYHHFADKQALFRAVVEREANAVAEEIERAAPPSLSAEQALIEGSRAFLDAMAVPGRTRLLLLDGPAVLGREVMAAIDAATGTRTLREGIAAAIAQRELPPLPVDALTDVLAAGFDRAALAIEAGAAADDYQAALTGLIRGLHGR